MSFDEVVESLGDSFENLAGRTADYLPKFLGALAVLIIGLIVAKLLAKLVNKLVDWVENNKWYEKLMGQANLKVKLAEPLEKLTYWVVLVIFLSAVVDILGLSVLTSTFNDIIAFIPIAVSAAVVVGIAIWGGRVLQDIVETTADQSKIDSRYKRVMGGIAYVAVLVFGVTIALGQLGFDTLIITTNVSLIVGGFALALALAFGLGSREIAGSLVAGMYAKNNVKKGQKLSVGDVHGTVKSVQATSVTLDTKDGDVVVPFSRIMK